MATSTLTSSNYNSQDFQLSVKLIKMSKCINIILPLQSGCRGSGRGSGWGQGRGRGKGCGRGRRTTPQSSNILTNH